MSFEEYLGEHYKELTALHYREDVRQYKKYMAEERADRAGYKEVSGYLRYLRKSGKSSGRIHSILYGIKAYYRYLLESGQRSDHPCRSLYLRDSRQRHVIEALLSEEELQRLLQRKPRYSILSLRDRVVIMFLIYQGLRCEEMVQMRTGDIDLQKATVSVRPSNRGMSRDLPLRGEQILSLHEYIQELRPRLMKDKAHDILLVTRFGEAQAEEGIQDIIAGCRKLFAGRKLTPQIIRMSVARNLLKSGKDIRLVQAYMGHRYPGSTERYKPDQSEALKQSIQQRHPLG